MGHNVVVDIKKHERTYIGFNGEIYDGPKGKQIGNIKDGSFPTTNQSSNPTADGQPEAAGTGEAQEGNG